MSFRTRGSWGCYDNKPHQMGAVEAWYMSCISIYLRKAPPRTASQSNPREEWYCTQKLYQVSQSQSYLHLRWKFQNLKACLILDRTNAINKHQSDSLCFACLFYSCCTGMIPCGLPHRFLLNQLQLAQPSASVDLLSILRKFSPWAQSKPSTSHQWLVWG